jgi:VIT1/CCC1 family predicted Fe2+/Mn2+ transporter
MIVLSVLSYGIAVDQKINPVKEILKHLGIALIAMIASHFVGHFISLYFS